MRHEITFVGQITNKRSWMSNISGMFHGPAIERNHTITKARPLIGSKIIFKTPLCGISDSQIRFFSTVVSAAFANQFNGLCAVKCVNRPVYFGILSKRNTRQIRRNFLIKVPNYVYDSNRWQCGHQYSVAVSATGRIGGNIEFEFAALGKIIEAGGTRPGHSCAVSRQSQHQDYRHIQRPGIVKINPPHPMASVIGRPIIYREHGGIRGVLEAQSSLLGQCRCKWMCEDCCFLYGVNNHFK